MKSLNNSKNIIWDFDGVILDSMKVRDLGFVEALKDFDKKEVEKLLIFHRENGGLSRYVKFDHFFKNILNREPDQVQIDDLCKKFSEIMRKFLTDKNLLINDSVNFIKNNYNKYKMHIASGSDEKELQYLCKELKIEQYFLSINGSPITKTRLVKQILEVYNYNKNETILIGDSINDFDAAKENEIYFYGFNNCDLKNLGQGYIKNF